MTLERYCSPSHLDHVGGTAALANNWDCRSRAASGQQVLDRCAAAGGDVRFRPGQRCSRRIAGCSKGDTVSVGNVTLQVRQAPGHTPGHVIFFDPASKTAWVGDVLFEGSIGRTDFPRWRLPDADQLDPRAVVHARRRGAVCSRSRADVDVRRAAQ